MRISTTFLSAFVLALGISPASAAPITLDFSGAICGATGDQACFNGALVGQNYGDVAGQLDVIWDSDAADAAASNVSHWAGGYETLPNVAYSAASFGGMLVTFSPLAGYEVSLGGFDIAPYLDRSRTTRLLVTDLFDSSILLNTGSFAVATTGVTSFALTERFSTAGISLLFGPDAFDVGISNITYTVRAVGSPPPPPPTPAIPLPATSLLLVGALGGLAVLRRRRKG